MTVTYNQNVFVAIFERKYVPILSSKSEKSTLHIEIREKWKSRRYAEKPHDTAVFRRSGPQGPFFENKNKKTVFRYGLGERVYQISGLYRF